jgi:PST family polysaccharide transporter
MLPILQINGPIGQVVVPALSRLQSSREQLRRYYLQVYDLSVSATLPIITVAIVFSKEIILVVLGEKWIMTTSIFQYLGFAGLSIAMLNPTGWLLVATGRTERYFRLGLLDLPFIILACVIGIHWDAEGVALGIALVRGVACLPYLYLCFRQTEVALGDIGKTVAGPYVSALAAAAFGYALNSFLSDYVGALVRLGLGTAGSLAVYALVLLVVFKRWTTLLAVGRAFLKQRSTRQPQTYATAAYQQRRQQEIPGGV